MEKAEIRLARLSDAEAIARLCSDDLGYACTASFVRHKLAAAHDFYRRNGYTGEKAQMRFIKTLAP